MTKPLSCGSGLCICALKSMAGWLAARRLPERFAKVGGSVIEYRLTEGAISPYLRDRVKRELRVIYGA